MNHTPRLAASTKTPMDSCPFQRPQTSTASSPALGKSADSCFLGLTGFAHNWLVPMAEIHPPDGEGSLECRCNHCIPALLRMVDLSSKALRSAHPSAAARLPPSSHLRTAADAL